MRRAFDERWIDYPMNQTKSTGGFCATVADGPSYILLNWTGLLSESCSSSRVEHGALPVNNQHAIAYYTEASLYFYQGSSS